MQWRRFCIVLCLLAAPLGAQVWKSDVPPVTHSWLGIDVGGAVDGSAARTKAAAALRAEVGSLVAPRTVLTVEGLLLLPGSNHSDCGVDAREGTASTVCITSTPAWMPQSNGPWLIGATLR